MKLDFGLVLSGGGTRGAVHAGVIQALQENDIKPDLISGCSAGSMAGSLYAAGLEGREILELFKKTSMFSHPSFSPGHPGLFELTKYRVHLEEFFPTDNFNALDIKLQLHTTDLLNGELCIHTDGKLIDYILASCAIPGIFTPLESGDRLLSDGGIVNVFPVSPIRDKVKKILGVNVTAHGIKTKKQIRNTRGVLDRSLTIIVYSKSKSENQLCDWLIDPPEVSSFNMISKKHLDEMFRIGYASTIPFIAEIKEYLNK